MKILTNDEYNEAVKCLISANEALIALKQENDKLKLELSVFKNANRKCK